MGKTEKLKTILASVGGDVNALPDNLKSTLYEAIIARCGGSVADLPDRLETTYLTRISECVTGGGTIKNQHKTFTENGIYRADSGYTGLGTVTVNVPQTGGGVNKLLQVVDRSVTEITFDDLRGASKIGYYALSGCYHLKRVEIPESVKRIEYGAFESAEDLLVVMEASAPPYLESYAFSGLFLDWGIVSVPYGAKNNYKNATNWSVLNIVERENTGGGSTGGDGNWLFKDQYLTTDGNATLPAPVVGTSYTVFVDGVEKVTTVCLDEYDWFMWDDGAVTYRYDEGWCFAFDPPSNALTESGTVSIRINS